MNDSQKTALITGGTEGIGYELARLFAKDKYNLILVARTSDELEKSAQSIKTEYAVNVQTISKDLIDLDAAKQVYDEAKSLAGDIDVLVNNAAQGQYGKFLETDGDREIDIIHLNIVSYVMLTKYFLKDMVAKNKGKILNVGSIAGETPGPWQSVYHGTKAFVHSWTEAINNEIKDSDVSLTLLLPGATDTEFFDKANMEESKIVKEQDLADPAKVAKDGFDALMAGKHKITSGLKNKVMTGMSNVIPDDMAAEAMHQQQKPSKK